MNMHYLVCGGAPILLGTSCNHTYEHALFGVWWRPSLWKPCAIIHSNMHYLVCGGASNFSGNLMQSYNRTCTIWYVVGPYFNVNLLLSYIRTCTIRCVVWAPILAENSCYHYYYYYAADNAP